MAQTYLLCIIAITLSVLCSTISAKAEISIYSISVEQFGEIEADFQNVVSAEASVYCDNSTCGPEFDGNLTASLSDTEDTKPNVNVTIIIISENGDQLSQKHTEAMFDDRRLSIQDQTNQKIVSVNEIFYGIAPDDPANWIIIAVVAVFTLVLLGVVLYLSKHKVNHVEEHYEEMKRKGSDSENEVAA